MTIGIHHSFLFNSRARCLVLLLFVFSGFGCAFAPPYLKVEQALVSQRYPNALAQLEKNKKEYGDKSRLLFYFDRLWLEHLNGNFEASNKYLESANRLIDDLYTKSISAEAMSFIGNDMNLAYAGENFERVLMHVVGMLNYIFMGNVEEAQVEGRRADSRLKQYSEKFGKDKVVYKEDALARYISAVLYEQQGQKWDAYIDYKKCKEAFAQYRAAYGTAEPVQLGRDLLRMAQGLGEKEDIARFTAEYPGAVSASMEKLQKEKGEVLVFLYEGLAPEKLSVYFQEPAVLSDGTRQIIQIAFPVFRSRQKAFYAATFSTGERVQPLEVFEDITSIALKDLDDRIAMIRVKAIARAITKFQLARSAQKAAKDSGGGIASLLTTLTTNIYTAVTEQADTRSWRILPGRIQLARMSLKPGKYNFMLRVKTPKGLQEIPFDQVKVEAGKKVFLKYAIY
jgi:uncharacterized protein